MIRVTIILALAAGLLTDFSAAQDQEKKRKKRAGGRDATQLLAPFKDLDLSEEQQTKMKQIAEKFAAPLQELRQKAMGAVSPETLKARREAGRKARAEGLKGKELQEAIDKAASIGEEAAAQMKEMREKMASMQKEMREAMLAVLTDEQRAKLPQRGPRAGGERKGKKKGENQGKNKGKKKKADDGDK